MVQWHISQQTEFLGFCCRNAIRNIENATLTISFVANSSNQSDQKKKVQLILLLWLRSRKLFLVQIGRPRTVLNIISVMFFSNQIRLLNFCCLRSHCVTFNPASHQANNGIAIWRIWIQYESNGKHSHVNHHIQLEVFFAILKQVNFLILVSKINCANKGANAFLKGQLGKYCTILLPTTITERGNQT